MNYVHIELTNPDELCTIQTEDFIIPPLERKRYSVLYISTL